MTTDNNKPAKSSETPKSEGLARSKDTAKDSIKPSSKSPAPAPAQNDAVEPVAESKMHEITDNYGLQKSKNEGAALADTAFDAIEYAFKVRAEQRAREFVTMANSLMTSFAQGMTAKSAQIRTEHLPESYRRPELMSGDE